MSDQGPPDDETVAITDVSSAPRGLGAERQTAELNHMNRTAALRTAENCLYFTRCACRWTGLRVADPEVARREYDAHVCPLDAVEIGVSLHRRGDGLSPNWAAETKAMLEQDAFERVLTGPLGPTEYRQDDLLLELR
jgi:hypothetical protein